MKCPPHSGRYEVTRPAGGAEDLDARPVRKEERPELENLVIFGKGLRRRGARNAEAGDEGRREQEATDLCDTHLQHEFNVTNEMDLEVQHFLISRTEGESLEVVRGAEREPVLEQWRRLAALCDPLAAGRSLDDSRQILSPPKAAQIDDLSHTIQACENIEQRHRERTGDQLPEDMRLAILLSMCPTDLEKVLTAQQHLFPDYAHMKAQIVTVVNSRTRGLASMMKGNLSDEDSNHHASSDESVESEDGELYRLEIRNGRKVFTESRHEPSKGKGGGNGKTDRERFRCGCHIRADCRARTHINGEHPNLRPKGKMLEIVRTKKQRPHKMCHWGPSIWGPLRYCPDRGDEMDDDESTYETKEMMPPLPPHAWFKRTETLCGKCRKPLQ